MGLGKVLCSSASGLHMRCWQVIVSCCKAVRVHGQMWTDLVGAHVGFMALMPADKMTLLCCLSDLCPCPVKCEGLIHLAGH